VTSLGPGATALMTGGESPHSSVETAPPAKQVYLTVTVLDGNGDPVTDLTSENFQIFDDGKAQEITSFRSSAGLFGQVPPPPTTVILLDMLNEVTDVLHVVPINREYISSLVVRALQPLETGDTVYLYILTNQGELYPVRALPTPEQWVIQARAAGARGDGKPADPPWTRQIRPVVDQAFQKVVSLRATPTKDLGYLAAATFQKLSDLGDQMGEIPGPKTLVLITRGVQNWVDYRYGCHDITYPAGSGTYVAGKCTEKCRGNFPCVDYTPFFQHISSELSRTNTVINSAQVIPEGWTPFTDRGSPTDTLRQLANLTGGRVYTVNEVEKAITQSLVNARARYQLAFDAPSPNGKLHKLRVACTRNGARIDAPKGYWADQP